MQTQAVDAYKASLPEGTQPPSEYIPDKEFGKFYLDTDVVKERGLKKHRVLGLGSLDQALPLLHVTPPRSCSSVVGGIDPASREEIDSMRARELHRDEECRQLREQLQAQIRAREDEAAEARQRQEEYEKELAGTNERIRMIEQLLMRSGAQISPYYQYRCCAADNADVTNSCRRPPTFRPAAAVTK